MQMVPMREHEVEFIFQKLVIYPTTSECNEPIIRYPAHFLTGKNPL